MRLPSCDHDETAWKFCFVHMVEVENHLESRCRELCASPTIGCNEKNEQAAKNSNDGSALLGFAFPNLEALAQISCHCKAGYCCPMAPQGVQTFLEIQIQRPGKASNQS